VCPDDRAINEGTDIVEFYSQLLEQPFPHATLRPTSEAVVHGLPAAIPLRDVAPGRARLQAPHHGVDEVAIPAPGPWTRGDRDQRFYLRPLLVAEFVSVHSKR
jgi:hypothetical protein